MTLTAELFDR